VDMPKNLSRRSMLQLGVVGGVGALGGTLLVVPAEDRDRLGVTLAEGGTEEEQGTRHGTFNVVLQRVARTPPGSHPYPATTNH
jgi:hypothetical protein